MNLDLNLFSGGSFGSVGRIGLLMVLLLDLAKHCYQFNKSALKFHMQVAAAG